MRRRQAPRRGVTTARVDAASEAHAARRAPTATSATRCSRRVRPLARGARRDRRRRRRRRPIRALEAAWGDRVPVLFAGEPATGVRAVPLPARPGAGRGGPGRRRRPAGMRSRRGRKSAKIQHVSCGKGALYRCPFVLPRRDRPRTVDLIRNFSIIAHIDHGKSTLADRFIQRCGGLAEREMEAQVLDSMDLERERGITIKAQTAALTYKARDGQVYNLNLIDTPGHVDFAYEVSRSLAACEGALLVVDASQGVEAQTVANCYTAIEQGVTVVPVLNKIDLPSAEPDRVIEEIEDIIGIPAHDALRCSAKTGEGVDDVLEAVIARIPPPKGDRGAPLQALIIDSWFDNYVGVVMLVRVMQGTLKPRDKILLMADRRHLQLRAGRRVHAEGGGARRRCRRARSASSSPASRRSTRRRSATR